jgi:hypothetical protein
MKKYLFHVAASALLFTGGLPAAAPITGAEKVAFRENKIIAWLDGKPTEVTNQVALPFNILIETNGTFSVDGGRARPLQEGDILGRDGMLLKPDGTIGPVMDHLTMNRGQVLRAEDGDAAPPSNALQLGDGTVVQPDRKVITASGSASWLQDGELLQPQGGTFAARDTITMQKGQVIVQKDGSQIVVGPTRSIMMNNGTKVMGDGTIIGFNGERSTVTEGQILPIGGIIVRRR